MALQILPQPHDPTTLKLNLSGSLDATTAPDLDQYLTNQLDAGTTTLVLDLGKLSFVSSAGLRIFAKAQRTLQSRQGKVYFVNLSPQVQKVFDIVKVASQMQIFTSIEELDSYLAEIQRQVSEGEDI